MSLKSLYRTVNRGYASVAPKAVQPPIHLQGLSGKYATALYSAVMKKDDKTISLVEKDVTSLQRLLSGKEGSKLRDFLQNPTLQPGDRQKGLADMMSKLSSPPHQLTKNLFEVLGDNRRLNEAEKVLDDFLNLLSAHRGEVTITITSAQPLDSSAQTRLESTLKKSSAAQGKIVKIKTQVNPSIMGGLIVDFGDKTIDMSVASKVNKLNGLLHESVSV